MNARRHCSMSGLHLNRKGTNILIENILFYLNKFYSNRLVTKVSEISKIHVYNPLGFMIDNPQSQYCLQSIGEFDRLPPVPKYCSQSIGLFD